MLRSVSRIAVAVLVCVLAGCGNEDQVAGAFPALSGEDVIDATSSEQTATFSIRDHGDPVDAGTDHGTSGEDEEILDVDASFDFARNRALQRWQFPADLVGDAIDVEVRTIDGISYVKDGSWLCPLCGFDDSDPPALPSDQWIVGEEHSGDVAFEFTGSSLHGQLGWLEFVDQALEPGDTSVLEDGTEVASYSVEVPVSDVMAAMKETDSADEFAPVFQGENVMISFRADRAGRLRELLVSYHLDDRARAVTATLNEFGSPVEIEVPPANEIYKE